MDAVGDLLIVQGPAVPCSPVVLDPPHFGAWSPSDFDASASEFDLRAGEDCVVDDRWCPAAGPPDG
jgi:hypothetical protein